MNNTQLQQVLVHLKKFKTITQVAVINYFNCFQLSEVSLLSLRKAERTLLLTVNRIMLALVHILVMNIEG